MESVIEMDFLQLKEYIETLDDGKIVVISFGKEPENEE